MRHNDRVRGALTIDGHHLMVINAGRGYWHSEETLSTAPPLRMLQILIRPRSSGLDPAMQFGPLPDVRPIQWRHLVGPEGGPASFRVRGEVDIYDIRLPAGLGADFPRAPRSSTSISSSADPPPAARNSEKRSGVCFPQTSLLASLQ